jgi:hypothetical protein
MNAFATNAATMKPDELKKLLKNRGVAQGGRKRGVNDLRADFEQHAQKPVEFEKLTAAGLAAELVLMGEKTPPKMKTGELREYVKAKAAAAAEKEAAEKAEQAAKEAAEKAAAAAQEGPAQAAQEPQAAKAATPNKKRKLRGGRVEAALSPVKVTAGEIRRAYHRERPKKGPTEKQQFDSDNAVFAAEFVRATERGKKTAKKAQRLETGENAYMLKPVVGQRLEVGFSVCVGGVEKKTLTWVPLAYVIANKQVHPGMKEAAQFARVPSKTIAEQERLDEAGEAYDKAVEKHNEEQAEAEEESEESEADAEEEPDESGSESDSSDSTV